MTRRAATRRHREPVSVRSSLIRNRHFLSIQLLHTPWWRLWSNNLLLGKAACPLRWRLKSLGTGGSPWKALKRSCQKAVWNIVKWLVAHFRHVLCRCIFEVLQFTLTVHCAHRRLPVCPTCEWFAQNLHFFGLPVFLPKYVQPVVLFCSFFSYCLIMKQNEKLKTCKKAYTYLPHTQNKHIFFARHIESFSFL